jgi:hypothetical protein
LFCFCYSPNFGSLTKCNYHHNYINRHLSIFLVLLLAFFFFCASHLRKIIHFYF